MPSKPGPKISFAQFGDHFADKVLSADAINNSVVALLHSLPPDKLHGNTNVEGHTVRFSARLHPPRTARAKLPDALRFQVTLPIALAVEIVSLTDTPRYTLRVKADLALVAYPCSPLFIVLEPQPFTVDSVQIDTEDKDEGWLVGFVAHFTNTAEQQVHGGVRNTVAKLINDALSGAGDSLCIDVEAKVKQSLSGGGGTATGPASGVPIEGDFEKPIALSADSRIARRYHGRDGLCFQLPASGPALKVKVCFRGPRDRNGDYLEIAGLDEHKVVEWSFLEANHVGRDDWNTHVLSFPKPQGQVFRARPRKNEAWSLELLVVTTFT